MFSYRLFGRETSLATPNSETGVGEITLRLAVNMVREFQFPNQLRFGNHLQE
jgi:hypothetical protein